MCSTVRCPDCEKVTWAGCGMHIEQALAGYSAEQICHCSDESMDSADTAPALQ
ncbi:MAG: hypothetical protein F2545_04025 [Actinobacteria bacterium]|uniref:Unannotated protein n=1 Tax=freshwater metagenome TaxID=449393 RepID=A0A6J6JZJ5_9ZZZZ|nr:hypothetical protein [Actinomycetota bacterium]